ncbi:MAG: hypothetical protein OEZ11_03975 [Gammaproteobacteria bacterium]|nr:hypothetical protein [Gammaproteobacteria bacterium]
MSDGLVFRRAVADDNDAILAFMRDEGMQAGMSFRFERAPDFFALHNAHSPDNATWLVTREGRIVSITSVVVRPAYIDGSIGAVAYLADLRQASGRGVSGLWRKVAIAVLDEIRLHYGATLAYCSILRDNRIASSSILESRLGKRLGFGRLRGYRTVSVVGMLPWRRWGRRRYEIRRALSSDSEELREFVDAQSRDLQLSPVFDSQTWQRRITGWPEFGIENFLIARDSRGHIAGCVAPWDSSAINRIVIDALPQRVELLRKALNAASVFTRRPTISVGASSHLPDLALTHIRVRDRDPEVFAELLTVAFRDMIRTRRYATLTFCLYDEDPLWRALRNMISTTVPMDLYCMSLGENAKPILNDELWPGFESYLV